MKDNNRIRYYNLYSPWLNDKSKWELLFLKVFNKAEYWKYMRCKAAQRREWKEHMKMLRGGYTKYLEEIRTNPEKMRNIFM